MSTEMSFGKAIPASDLQIAKAREVALVASNRPYVRVVDTRRFEGSHVESVILEVDAEVGQHPVHGIRPTERLGIVFDPDDEHSPAVYALRHDFPRPLPHQILESDGSPQLCIYEEPYQEVRMHWSALDLIRRIRNWLALTAKGALHAPDQPLEPLLEASSVRIVIPRPMIFLDNSAPILTRCVRNESVLVVSREPITKPSEGLIPVVFRGCPQTHGVISRSPLNLQELNDVGHAAGLDLVRELRSTIQNWMRTGRLGGCYDARLLVIVILPKTRGEGQDTEALELRAFLTEQPLRDVGASLALWAVEDGLVGMLLGPPAAPDAEHVHLSQVSPMFALDRELASACSGLKVDRDCPKITLLGVGALGSQICLDLARMGFGLWRLVDSDVLYPHNLARHALLKSDVGKPKAAAMSDLLNSLTPGVAEGIVADALGDEPAVDGALKWADLIVDCSTSIAVSRHLALDIDADARRLALFLNPKGTDAVLLLEDAARQVRLDFIEMQYYWAVWTNGELADHLSHPPGVRYSASCRDTSALIPQDLVALHAANCSRAVRAVQASSGASLRIWRTRADTIGVTTLDCRPVAMELVEGQEWRLYFAPRVVDQANALRLARLPHETGGVLIGSVDVQRRLLYVVGLLPSPEDSEEWPCSYVRGYLGLSRAVEEIRSSTLNMLQYLGEWHSHPTGHGPTPSPDDRRAFQILTEELQGEGFPPVMLIVGDTHRWYFEAIDQ